MKWINEQQLDKVFDSYEMRVTVRESVDKATDQQGRIGWDAVTEDIRNFIKKKMGVPNEVRGQTMEVRRQDEPLNP